MKGKRKSHILLPLTFIFLIFWTLNPIWGQDVKLKDTIKFLAATELPINVIAFCVTEDELFIIPDYKAGNIKIYERTGECLELVNTIGRKGYGPEELSRPAYCYYDNNESKFVVLDFGIRKIFIYDRIGRIHLKRVKEVSCWRAGYDIQLKGYRIFISGHKQDKNENPYDFYYIDLRNDETTFLLPSYFKNGHKDFEEYLKKPQSPAIGIKCWFDIHKDDAYFVWEGNLKIIKLNIESGEIDANTFKMKLPSHYVKPYSTKNLEESLRTKNMENYKREKAKMSYVRDVFVNSNYVLLIYEGPLKQDELPNFRILFYSLDGNLKNEVVIKGKLNGRMWFDKENEILYSLPSKSHTSREQYVISKYEIKK